MKFLRFRIATLLLATAMFAVALEPIGDYFGLFRPNRRARNIIEFVDRLHDSVSYEQFRTEMSLPEISIPPPMGGSFGPGYGGSWELGNGYTAWASFTDDDMLVNITITDIEMKKFAWGWARGDGDEKLKQWLQDVCRQNNTESQR